jgi:dipeptidyl aminopeptidase/acylaminoacyl peptidase
MTAAAPSDVFALDAATQKVTRWTRSEIGAVDASRFVEPELVRYTSADGLSIPAFLYLPRGAAGRVPVVVSWHGGPESQARPIFAPQAQMWVAELGAAVLVPNVRGSSGYGKSYIAADNGVLREKVLQDIGATLDFIASRFDLDPARVAVIGGSYGGYMTLATAAFFPDRVRAAVDIVGISSLATFLEHTQPYRRDLRRAEYGDERIAEVRAVQDRISPLYSADKISAAMFVQQGKNDPRVPQSEAEQIVGALRARQRPVWYLLALNEGHGFQKKENRDFSVLATAAFLREHLSRAR